MFISERILLQCDHNLLKKSLHNAVSMCTLSIITKNVYMYNMISYEINQKRSFYNHENISYLDQLGQQRQDLTRTVLAHAPSVELQTPTRSSVLDACPLGRHLCTTGIGGCQIPWQRKPGLTSSRVKLVVGHSSPVLSMLVLDKCK